MEKRISKYVKDNFHPYTGAEYLGKWKEYEVYQGTIDTDEPLIIGFPLFILEQDSKVKVVDHKDIFTVFDHFMKEEE